MTSQGLAQVGVQAFQGNDFSALLILSVFTLEGLINRREVVIRLVLSPVH